MREQHGPIKERREPEDEQVQGLHFGNYDLVSRIDVGGMGEVYLAHQRTAFGRLVAIKIIRPDLVHDVIARQRFLREAEVSAHLKHEHILQLVEFGEEQGRLFLVTPYIEGGTLLRRLQRGPLSLTEVHTLFSALAGAIAYIHKRGVVHRDLKPSNILLDQEGDQVYVRLIDFGIATLQGDFASPQLTTAGNEMGTIAYMAPERLSGVAAPSNDIFSLGIILYQMITGHLPSATGLTLPQPMKAVYERASAPDPLDRYATADELLRNFELAYQMMNTAAPMHKPLAPVAAEEDDGEALTVRRTNGSQQLEADEQNSLVLRSMESEDVYPQSAARSFKRHEYAEQTAFLTPEMYQAIALQDRDEIAVPSKPSRLVQPKRRKRSLVAFISLFIVLILFIMAGTIFIAFEAAISATVTISPQTHALSTVFTMHAQPQLHTIDVANAAVPLYSLQNSNTGTHVGPTTVPNDCLLSFLCQRIVTYNDVNTQITAIRSRLEGQITSTIQQQIAAKGGTMIGTVQFTDVSGQANPPIGTASDTVSVTLTEQGAAMYVLAHDAQTLARQLLQQKVQQQYGPSYALLNQLTQIGQPALQSVSANTVTLAIAAGGVAEYQLSTSQISAIQSHLKGMKLQVARAYLLQQPGLDPALVIVRISYGNTMPSNIGQIKLNAINPTNLPTIQLPAVTPAATPSVASP